MKKTLIILSILTSFAASAQSIEISPNGGTTNSSAILDLKSTTKGFLLPRMTNAQMLAIQNPAQGLLAFCTNCGSNGDYYVYKGSAWVTLGSTSAVLISTTVGPLGASATPNGATMTNGVLSLAPADANNPGIVSTTAQTIAGAKTFSAAPVLSTATASQAVFTDANKNIVSNAITGTGNVVMSTSPTLVSPALGTPSTLVGTNITGTANGLNIGGNAATVSTNANLTGVVTSTGNVTSIANGAISNAMLANAAVANLSGINTGDQTLPTYRAWEQ